MGSPSDSPTMGCLGYLSLVALLFCGIQGASLPYQDGYQLHLNQNGVIIDLEMKDLNPLVGGKAHVELPISDIWRMLELDAQLLKPIISSLEKTTLPVWKLLEVEAPFLKPILITLEKNTLGRINDVMTLKADITYNAKEILKGIFNVAVDYTLVHKDGTEEKATLLIQEKNQSGQSVTSVEIIPKNNVVMPEKKIFFPLEMIITCNWPSAHTLSMKGDFGKMFINIANNMNEVSVRGVLEYLGQQYKFSNILSIGGKYFTVTLQGPSKDLYDIVIKFNMLNGFPRIEITGNIPTFQYFKAGDFKSEVIVNSWLNYKIKHTFHGLEVFSLKFEMLDGFPRVKITGNVPTTRLFTAGIFKSELIVKSLYNYEFKHVFKGMEMLNLKIAIKNGKMNINVAVIKDTTEIINAVVNNVEVPYMMVLKAPLLPLEMKVDYELSTKVWNIKINNKSILEVRPTVTNEVEVVLTGVPLFGVALLAKEVRIATIMKDLPEITTAVTLKTF